VVVALIETTTKKRTIPLFDPAGGDKAYSSAPTWAFAGHRAQAAVKAGLLAIALAARQRP
jgi:hypothetical protein